MIRYIPKINGVYKRYESGPRKHRFIIGDFSVPEYAATQHCRWTWTFKYDGTSCGIYFGEEEQGVIFGKTKKTNMSFEQQEVLDSYVDKIDGFLNSGLTVYGEFVGPKINGNRHGLSQHQFIPFDVRSPDGSFWPKQRVLDELPDAAGIVSYLSLRDAINYFSNVTPVPGEEGWVGTPDLCDLRGKRIITKLKWQDFQ